MCGIAGIVHLDSAPVSPVVLQRMTDAIAHRGPDGEGHWVEGNVGIGHRRLAIIDLSPAGHQPMVSADHRYVLSYNGEIYNFRELRSELEAKGRWFRSRTDSEVLLNALAEWGPAAIGRLNGMFAFGLWDRKERTLLLARDRYGIKPLYISQQGTTFAFGSEQKAILQIPGYRRLLDKQALVEYFTFQNIFTDKTLLEGISLLPAGNYAVLDLKKTKPELLRHQYWDYDFREPDEKTSDEDYIEELDRLFQQAVNRQLISDVEVGSYLSGGMDSGSITAIAARSYPYLKTFTCGFDLRTASGLELVYDEREKAELMSYLFRTEHYEIVLKSGDMERVLPKYAYALEEPRVGQSYPNYYVAQLASKFVKVVLSGAGGDELFAGYPWRYYKAVFNDDFDHYVDKYYLYWQRLLDNRHIKTMFSPIWGDVNQIWTRDIFASVFADHNRTPKTPTEYVNHSLYFEAKTFLHGLLNVEDKLSMAHSLETRVPFLDNDLVDLAMRLPVRLKLANFDQIVRQNENDPGKGYKYMAQTGDGKIALRKLMEKYLPQDITGAVKQGFSAPDASWFRGDSIDYVKKTLLRKDARIYEFLDPVTVRSLVSEHIDGLENRRLLVWSLINFENWCEKFL